MNTYLKDSVVNLYDKYMNQAGGKLKYEDVREKLVPEVMAVLEERERNVETEARTLIKATLDSTRRNRSNNMRKSLEDILDYLADPEEAALSVQPIMECAFPLGDGQDMTLRYWKIEDFFDSRVVRYREAAAATEAAKQYDEQVSALAQLMRARGATTLGDLVGGETNVNA